MLDVRSFFQSEGYITPQPLHQSGLPLSVFQNLDLLLRMEFARNHPNSLDILEVLEVTRVAIEDTRRCVGTVMFQRIDTRTPIGTDFIFIRDVKAAVQMYCRMDTERHQIKYKNLLKHVIHPLLESFRYMSHQEALECYEDRINALVSYIKQCPYEYDDVDAKIAFRVLMNTTRARQQARDAADYINEKRTKVKK